MSFPTGWTKKCSLTIDNTKVSGTANLSNFPVLLTEVNFPSTIFDNTLSTGADLRFTSDADGTTELAFEVVNWDTTNDKAEVWVKVPTVDCDDDTTFYVWYGNATAEAYAEDATYGSDACWDTYTGVYHMENNPASTTVTKDSSSNDYDMTEVGNLARADGKIGNCVTYDGTGDYYYILLADAPNFNGTGSFTISAWTNSNNVGAWQYIWQQGYDTNTHNVQLLQQSGSKISGYAEDNSAGAVSTSNTSINTWYYVTYAYDSVNGKSALRFNGAEEHNPSVTGARQSLSTTRWGGGSTPVTIGGNSGNNAWGTAEWYGELDEVRFSNGVFRSADWHKTEYNNQSAPSTFVTEGTETDVGSTGISASKRSINC